MVNILHGFCSGLGMGFGGFGHQHAMLVASFTDMLQIAASCRASSGIASIIFGWLSACFKHVRGLRA
jgi:predicted transporter